MVVLQKEFMGFKTSVIAGFEPKLFANIKGDLQVMIRLDTLDD